MKDETDRGRPRTADDVNALNNILTPEMEAAGWWRHPVGGGLIPPNVRNEHGWQGDRDAVNSAVIIAAHRAMSRAVATYREKSQQAWVPGADLVAVTADVIRAADVMAACWDQFTQVTDQAGDVQ